MGKLLDALPAGMQRQLQNYRSLILYTLRDMREHRQRRGLIPQNKALLFLFRYEDETGISVTALNASGLDAKGVPEFMEQGQRRAYFKLLGAAKGRFAIGANKPIRKLAKIGGQIFDRVTKREAVHTACPGLYAWLKNDHRPDMTTALVVGLMRGTVEPAPASDLRAKKYMARVRDVKTSEHNIVLIYEDEKGHARTWPLPRCVRPAVGPGSRLERGQLLASPFRSDAPLTPEAQNLLEFEAAQIRYVRADQVPCRILDPMRPLYLKRIGWNFMMTYEVPAGIETNPLYRRRFKFMRANRLNQLRSDGLWV